VNSPSEAVVEVLYALPEKQVIVELNIEPGMTAALAVERSGLIESYPSISEQDLVFGVWGVEVSPNHPLKPGDRVEISRPLEADPRVMRRELMTDGRVMGGAQAPDSSLRKKARE
jgi:putative ubiquitin-RnfH superfamily antitoxin RatB of RatAB toxin-antitoxin module